MIHSLIHFSTLATSQFAEEHPPTELGSPFNFGLSPFGIVVVVLLIIAVAWLAMNAQAGRGDLHMVDHGHDHHNGNQHSGSLDDEH